MTTLAIMATYEKKRLKCYGTVAAGEHVAVTVTDGAQWIGEGKALRLRVLFGPDTVGVFPFADGDAWMATGTQNADAYCELNLNTLQAEKYLKRGGTCLWILDDVENHTLYATGEFDVLPWPKRRGIDEPIDLDGYPLLLDEIKDLKEAFEEYQRTVAQMLAMKQDTIFDLATIRSGAAAGATAVQPSQIARFVDDAEYKAQYGEQNKPAILFKHGTDVIVALDATPFVKDGMVSSVAVVGGNLVITFNTDSGKQPITVPLTDIFDPDNYYDKGAVDALLDGKQDALTFDNAPTAGSDNPVKSGGIWSAIWGALSALPSGFSSLYDWCVAQLAGKLDTSGGTMTGGIAFGTEDDYGYMGLAYDDETHRLRIIDVWNENTAYLEVPNSADGSRVAFMNDVNNAITAIAPDWVSGTSYDAWDVVKYNGAYYYAKADTSGTTAPSSDDTNWGALANLAALAHLFLPLSGGVMDGSITFGNVEIYPLGNKLVFHGLSGDYEVQLSVDKDTDIALLSNIASDFSSSATYALNELCVYNRVLYRCTTAITTAENWTPAHWTQATVEDVLAALRTGKANRASPATAGNLAALDASGNLADSGIAAGDLLTIVALTNSTETMASILARLNAINAAHKHVFFDCSGINVNPRLYLCTIMIDADANAVRVYDQVTGKLYIGPYDAAETIGEVFAKAVDTYHSITVSAVTLDGVTVTGQTVTIREGTDATAPVYATATITDGAPVTFVVPKGMIYFLEITDTLADHFGPRVTSGAKQGIATADAAVTFTYYDAEHIDTSEITTFAKLQEALTWFGTNETAARNNLVGIEIADTWTATNGTVYDNPRVVWDVHYFEDESGVRHLGALMGTKYCSYNDVQFDAAEGEECDSSTETVAEAGVYYYGLALGQTSKTAANLTLLELSEGAALPYADYAKIYKSAIRDTTRNSLQYGYNNWRDSAYRQYLNSDAATGQWWGATHIGDVAPSLLNSIRGFMAGCSAALLAAAKKVKVATWPNSVTDGPNQITTLYETLDTFFLPSGSEVYGDVNRSGGASVEGELSPYWQVRTGYTAPNNTATATRIIYRELPVGSTANRSAAGVRLRSANRGHSGYTWIVSTSGQVYTNYSASSALASVPACVIY